MSSPPLNPDVSSSNASSSQEKYSPIEDVESLNKKIQDLLEQTQLQQNTQLSVVAFLGLSSRGVSSDTGLIANVVIGKNVFNQPVCGKAECPWGAEKATLLASDEYKNSLWFYFDSAKGVAYLLLESPTKIELLRQIETEARRDMVEGWFQGLIWKHEHAYVRMLLLVFSLSHVIVMTQPASALDANIISILHTLTSVKRHIMPHMSTFLSACWQSLEIAAPYAPLPAVNSNTRSGVSFGGILSPGRCVPVLVFLCTEVHLSQTSGSESGKSEGSTNEKAASVSIKRVKETLQTRLRFLFRACHVAQSTDLHASFDSRQLFTLPPPSSQFFVHLVTQGSLSNIMCPDTTRAMLSSWNEHVDMETLLRRRRTDAVRGTENFEVKLLKEFVTGWIKWASVGYPRSVTKRGVPNSELPNAIQWVSGCIALEEFLFGTTAKQLLDRKGFSIVDDTLQRRLTDTIQVNKRFSASHCVQMMRKAIDLYLSKSPPFYTRKYHEAKLDQAMRAYLASSRGPCVWEYAETLRLECHKIWEQSRQKCERESLTSHECMLGAAHSTVKDQADDDNTKHKSDFQAMHACNCGRTRRAREDPFDLKDANTTFFKFPYCCNQGENVSFTFPRPKFSSASMWSLIRLSSGDSYRHSVGVERFEGFATNTNFLLPWDIPIVIRDPKSADEDVSNAKDQHGIIAEVNEESILSKGDLKFKKRSSRVDEKMLGSPRRAKPPKGKVTEESPKTDILSWPALNEENPQLPGAPPAFQLFHGLQLARKVHYSADVRVRANPVVMPDAKVSSAGKVQGSAAKDRRSRHRRSHRKEREKVVDQVPVAPVNDNPTTAIKGELSTLRGFLGVEYECPLGHRFMSCGEGRVCKLGHLGHTKENASALLDQELPIYILCPCNNTVNGPPSVTAQMQRIVIVTPNSPLLITLNPLIKESGSNTFVSALSEDPFSVTLPRNSMMVLRLPYIHYDAEGLPIKLDKEITKRIISLHLQRDFVHLELLAEE